MKERNKAAEEWVLKDFSWSGFGKFINTSSSACRQWQAMDGYCNTFFHLPREVTETTKLQKAYKRNLFKNAIQQRNPFNEHYEIL